MIGAHFTGITLNKDERFKQESLMNLKIPEVTGVITSLVRIPCI
jgi:hypothetical protein